MHTDTRGTQDLTSGMQDSVGSLNHASSQHPTTTAGSGAGLVSQ